MTGLGAQREKQEGRIVIYRRHFEKLLACPKPLRDQLILDLPTLQALRSGEVSSLRVEWIDFERGDLTVLDSKKFKRFMVPLDPTFARHAAEYIQTERLSEGILIQPLPGAPHTGRRPGSKTQGAGLSVTQIDRIWARWEERCGIPYMPARVGRAYFATDWHFVKHKSLYGLMAILRHDDIQSTEHYLNKLVCYEDFKAEFYQGMLSPFISQCENSDKCPVAIEDCHCKFYKPRIEGMQRMAPLTSQK